MNSYYMHVHTLKWLFFVSRASTAAEKTITTVTITFKYKKGHRSPCYAPASKLYIFFVYVPCQNNAPLLTIKYETQPLYICASWHALISTSPSILRVLYTLSTHRLVSVMTNTYINNGFSLSTLHAREVSLAHLYWPLLAKCLLQLRGHEEHSTRSQSQPKRVSWEEESATGWIPTRKNTPKSETRLE